MSEEPPVLTDPDFDHFIDAAMAYRRSVCECSTWPKPCTECDTYEDGLCLAADWLDAQYDAEVHETVEAFMPLQMEAMALMEEHDHGGDPGTGSRWCWLRHPQMGHGNARLIDLLLALATAPPFLLLRGSPWAGTWFIVSIAVALTSRRLIPSCSVHGAEERLRVLINEALSSETEP